MDKKSLEEMLQFLNEQRCNCSYDEDHYLPSEDWQKYQPLLVQLINEKMQTV